MFGTRTKEVTTKAHAELELESQLIRTTYGQHTKVVYTRTRNNETDLGIFLAARLRRIGRELISDKLKFERVGSLETQGMLFPNS